MIMVKQLTKQREHQEKGRKGENDKRKLKAIKKNITTRK